MSTRFSYKGPNIGLTNVLGRLVIIVIDVVRQWERIGHLECAIKVKTEQDAVRAGTMRFPSVFNNFGNDL